MKKSIYFLTLFFFCGMGLIAQVGINSDNSMPHSSAMLEVKSTGKGFLPPRMTQIEMNAISGPAQGLLVYNTDANALFW